MFLRIFILFFLIGFLFNLANANLAQNDGESHGEKLFKANCAGCHMNGKNLIKPDKPIIGSKKLKSKVMFKAFIASPPVPMPSFKNITSKPEDLNALYSYVVSLMGN